MTTYFLPSLEYVRTLMKLSLYCIFMSILLTFNLLFSLLSELAPEPVSTPGNAEPWPLTAPSSYPPQNAQSGQQHPYAPVWGSSTHHPFFDNPVFQPSQTDDDINRQDHNGQTRLHHSVIKGSVQEVEDLLSLGAATDIQDSQRDQPLHYAASRALEGILRLLLKRGANINAKGRAGMTPLHMSLRFPRIFKALLQMGPTISTQDDQGDTPLHLALSSTLTDTPPKGSTVEKLILSGADVNVRNHAGITPFHMVLEKKCLGGEHSASFLVMFLENGALISSKTADGRLPFEVFLENSNFRWAEYGTQYGRGAMPDRKRNLGFKQFIAKGADPNTRLTSGETLLNEALNRGIHQYGHDADLALLLCKSADINNAGLHGDYPLHCLLRHLGSPSWNIDIVKDFLRRGANPNEANQAGESPLLALLRHRDYPQKFMDVADVLMQSGANPTQRDLKGELPIYIAARKSKNLDDQCKWLKPLLEAKQPDGMTQRAVRLGETLHDDQDWWDAYYGLYQACSWSSPAYLVASSHRLPTDISEPISKTALNLIAEKFLSSTQACFTTLKETRGLHSHDTRNMCDQIVAILRDCRVLEIDIDQKWYHLPLEMFD
jgi:ankyrin repeat protein